jgi:flagellar FliL protein
LSKKAEKDGGSTATEEGAAEAAAPRKSRKLLILIAAGVLGLAGGAGGFLALRGGEPPDETAEHGEGHPEESAHGETQEHGPSPEGELGATQFVALETLIVNVRDQERTRYLKVTAEVELSGDGARTELEQRMPQVKDYAIGLLSSQTAETLQTLEGKARVREELMARLNALLRSGRVLGVYFTEFVIQ